MPHMPLEARLGLLTLGLAALLIAVIACDQPSQPASTNGSGAQAQSASRTAILTNMLTNSLPSSTPSSTGIPDDPLTEQAYEGAYVTSEAQSLTRVAPTVAIIARTYTAIALGPTITPLPIYPTATPALGFFNCVTMTYSASSCWSGTVGGQLLTIVAGRAHGDQFASVEVFHGVRMQYRPALGADEYYSVPCEVRSVGIASIDGTRFTLIPQDLYNATPTPVPTPVVLVFDLATRQWISSTCGPLPPTYTPGSLGW